MSKEDVKNLHQSISKNLLPRSQQIHTHIKDFLNGQIRDIQNINIDNDKVLDRLKDEYDLYHRTNMQLKNKMGKDRKFVQGGNRFLKAKEEEVSAKKKILQSISTGLKESVSKVKPQKLAELPYEKEPILKELFSNLFSILYNEDKSKYNWQVLKNKALLHYEGQDFLTRLANINYRDLPQTQYFQLLKLKNDEQFKNACENSSYAVDIVDLADWVDYVCEGYKLTKEKKQCEYEYHKILVDKEKRAANNTQLKEQFCTQTLKDIDNYQNNIMWLQSELRTLKIGMNSSIEQINEINQNRQEKIKKINDL